MAHKITWTGLLPWFPSPSRGSDNYLLGASLALKYIFDVHPEDKFACMADVGWITGHT